MAENESTQTKKSTAATSQLGILDMLFLTLRRWPWILLSVAICLGVAGFYVLRTVPLYTRSSEIIINTESEGKSLIGADFAEAGLIKTNNNIGDEINKLRSPDVMTTAVKRLSLDMSYFVDGTYHDELLYGSDLPIKVEFPSLTENESASMKVEVLSGGYVKLSNLKSSGGDIELHNADKVKFGDTVRTSIGPIVVNRTPYLRRGANYEIDVVKAPLPAVVSAFSSELTVTQKSDKSHSIVLSVVDRSIQRADDLLNMIVTVYSENWIRTKNQISVSTSEFINERLGVIERELGNVDQDISSYKSEHQIPDVAQAASMYMSENQAADNQLLGLNNQLQLTRYVRDFVTNTANRNQLLPTNLGIGSTIVEGQIAEYNAKLMQRNQYVANSSESNPVIENLDSQLAGMRSTIIQSIDNQITSLNTTIRNIQGSKNRATAQIAANPTQAKYLLSVERQQKVKESLYLFLLQKREENELSQAFTAYNTEIVTRPHGPAAPTSPDSRRILLIAFAIGLAVPVGLIYLKESNNTKVRGRRDVKDLRLPFLGEIPMSYVGDPKAGKSKKMSRRRGNEPKTVIVQENKHDVINEAFRVLRTNLELMNARNDGNGTVIAMTSFNPGSGKSFMTVNLAYALALKGKKVLVIDGDMRHGSASAYIGSPDEGMADYLSGRVDDLYSVITSFESAPSLHVLPVGSTPPNPTELLENGRFAHMLEMLRANYDYIFIDCPPIEIVADVHIIDQYVDRTVFIVRAGLLERSMLAEMDRLYDEKKFRNMAFILNGTDGTSGRYGYAGSYRYGYGYGYGYSYAYGHDRKKK